MIKSMTAYSRASIGSSLGRFVIEIHTVNRKMLDISLHLPRDMLRFDVEMRKWISSSIERGQITMRVVLQGDGTAGKPFDLYAAQLKDQKLQWDKIAAALGYNPKEAVDLPFLVSQMQPLSSLETKEEENQLRAILKEGVENALKDLMRMKEVEGGILALDLEKRLKSIEECLHGIELKKEEPLDSYRQKISERMKEMGHFEKEAQERVAREIILLMERMDVTEELVRLNAHVAHFRAHLASKEKSVGRTLDFLAQEMHREVNTLGAKSADSALSLYVVKIKGEIDKIREQVQNIE